MSRDIPDTRPAGSTPTRVGTEQDGVRMTEAALTPEVTILLGSINAPSSRGHRFRRTSRADSRSWSRTMTS
jgi:hypothetical protein